MAFKSTRIGLGLGLGKVQSWNFIKNSKKENSVYKEYIILQYIFSIYNQFITLPKKGVKTKKKSKKEKKFRIPILIGNVLMLNNYSKLFLCFNFFFDFDRLEENELLVLYYRIFKAFLFLKKNFFINFSIISSNIFSLSYNLLPNLLELNVDPKDKILKEYEKVSPFYRFRISFFRRLYLSGHLFKFGIQ